MAVRRRSTPASTRALCRELRRQGRSVREIVAAAAALGHVVTRSAVGRMVGPPAKPRSSRAAPAPARLARTARRLAGPGGDAVALLEAAVLELRQVAAVE